MGRWQPDALPRLQAAAWELFVDQGYEQTTVDQIAQRAGLTQRTFFRYFSDKKEVLFAGTEVFETQVVDAVKAQGGTDPLARIFAAFEAVAAVYFDPRPGVVRRRRAIIESAPELQEREGQKMARVADAVARVLAETGHPGPTARFAADLGVLVFRAAFAEWADGDSGTLTDVMRRKREVLRSLAGRP